MDEARRPGYWAVLPAAVRYDNTLTAAAKILYAEISSMTESRGYCFAANRYFMELYGITERTLQRHLNALAAGGYIRILDGDGGKRTRKIYAGVNPLGATPAEGNPATADAAPLPLGKGGDPPRDAPGSGASRKIPPAGEMSAQRTKGGRTPPPTGKGAKAGERDREGAETPPDKNDGGPPTKMTGPPDKNDGGTLNSKNYQEENIIPPKAPQGAGVRERRRKKEKAACEWEPEMFERFWKMYPRGEDKAKARYEWDELKPDLELMRKMSAALKRQMLTDEWRRGVGIPYACRYLSNRRWEAAEKLPPATDGQPGRPASSEEGLPWI